MRRLKILPRSDWQDIAEANAFLFHHINGDIYWDETACYEFSEEEVESRLIKGANEIEAMCLDIIGRACESEEIMEQYAIPADFRDAAVDAWRNCFPGFYGRMDFSYNGQGEPKLLEYNADTPTSLYEAAWFQRLWLDDVIAAGRFSPAHHQFNFIQEKISGFFVRQGFKSFHLACMSGSMEDLSTIAYLAALATQTGAQCKLLYMEEIGLTEAGKFVDQDDQTIENLFKLYPWEYIWKSEFGPELLKSDINVIEPAWKMFLSTKALLPLLWKFYPDHPNLLPAYFGSSVNHGEWIIKPALGREGANMEISENGHTILSTGGDYADGRYIHQKLCMLPNFEGNYPVTGIWIVDDEACGIGIREDRSPITTDGARFIPHIVRD